MLLSCFHFFSPRGRGRCGEGYDEGLERLCTQEPNLSSLFWQIAEIEYLMFMFPAFAKIIDVKQQAMKTVGGNVLTVSWHFSVNSYFINAYGEWSSLGPLLVNGVPIFHSRPVFHAKASLYREAGGFLCPRTLCSTAGHARTTSALAVLHTQAHTEGQPAKGWRWAVGWEDLHCPTMQLLFSPPLNESPYVLM